METQTKYFLVGLFVVLAITSFNGVDGAGECGKSSPDNEAFKLLPCASAAQDANASPSSQCCSQVKKIGQNPSCLCAIMLSKTAKSSGAKPEIALTIPQRCNLADRPVGYKCGRKFLRYLILPYRLNFIDSSCSCVLLEFSFLLCLPLLLFLFV